jgi:hypothetical protein
MNKSKFLVLVCAVCVCVSIPALADGRGGNSSGPGPGDYPGIEGGGILGADGTLYLLQHDATASTTAGTSVSNLIAIGPTATPATAWKVAITGSVGEVVAATSTVYAVVTTTTGTGSTATRSTVIQWFNAATGVVLRSTAISGSVGDISAKTVGGKDLLYVTTTLTTTTTTGTTTTTTTTHTVTIYNPDGTVLKAVSI